MSLIEVMIPCFNYGRFLRQCVRSVLDQPGVNLRVVILDDASTDETPAVAAELAAEDRRVTVDRAPRNRGHIATYNHAIARARGDYLLLLSADDFLLPGALGRAVRVLDRAPGLSMVFGGFITYADGDPVPDTAAEPARPVLTTPHTFVEKLSRGNKIATATVVVRTLAQQGLGPYRANLPHAADLEMWLRFTVNTRIAYIRARQAAYRRHDANMSLGYSRLEDADECICAFGPHLVAISRMPDGGRMVSRIHDRLKTRWQALKAEADTAADAA